MSIAPSSLFVVQHFLSRWDTTNFYTSTGALTGTIMLDLQSSSCVHCQLFLHTQQQPRGPAVLHGSPLPAARDNTSGSQLWYVPPPNKLGQLDCTPRELPAQYFLKEIRPLNLQCGKSRFWFHPLTPFPSTAISKMLQMCGRFSRQIN